MSNRMYEYYATGKHTQKAEDVSNGFYLEFNASIKMWRIQHPNGIPKYMMGYSPHPSVLRKHVHNYVRKHK